MKTLYLECKMGAAGDMLMAALYELIDNKEAFLDKMNHLLPEVSVQAKPAEKCGILGTHMEVKIGGEEELSEDVHEHHHHHEERSMGTIITIMMRIFPGKSMSTTIITMMRKSMNTITTTMRRNTGTTIMMGRNMTITTIMCIAAWRIWQPL